VLVALQNIWFYHPRVAFRQLCINCRRYTYFILRLNLAVLCQRYKYVNISNYNSSYALGTQQLQNVSQHNSKPNKSHL